MQLECTIRVIRRGGYADMLRRYKILANGTGVGAIGRNSTLEFKVPSGRATIQSTIDWCQSELVTFDAPPGGLVEFEVANKWGALKARWAITAGRDSYLMLRMTHTVPQKF